MRCRLDVAAVVSQSFEALQSFIRQAQVSRQPRELRDPLATFARQLGFEHFALVRHAGRGDDDRLHNYPPAWVIHFDRSGLHRRDPVHRASRVARGSFRWQDLQCLVTLSDRDRAVLEQARDHGLAVGFTVPTRAPGSAGGSCSFASGGDVLPTSTLLDLAELAAVFAFEALRRLDADRATATARLTGRQRECVTWVARGKSDWEIARILGVGVETVMEHLKQARDRYGVYKRTSLLVQALFDGEISFEEIAPRRYPAFEGDGTVPALRGCLRAPR